VYNTAKSVRIRNGWWLKEIPVNPESRHAIAAFRKQFFKSTNENDFIVRHTIAVLCAGRRLYELCPPVSTGFCYIAGARSVVVNLFNIGTHFEICSLTCTPLPCTNIKFCKSAKTSAIFTMQKSLSWPFLDITYQHSWTPKSQSKSDFCFCSHANNPPL